MVSDYKRKTGRGDWSMIAMKKAVDKVLSKKMGYKLASRQYSVPRTTLARYVKTLKQGDEVNLDLPLGPLKTVFDPKEEEELVTYFNDLEKRFFCLTTVNMRQMAYQLAVKHGKKHNFSRVKRMAGEDWAKSFIKRHPDLSIRKSRANAGDRALRVNKEALDEFYHLLRGIYDEYKLTPDKIYNCGETGISIVSETKTKMRKEMGSLSHVMRGQTVTMELCFNAAGYYVPPLMVFPEQNMSAGLLNHAPPGTIAECNASGGMTKEIFLKWLQHFIKFSGASPSNQILLLVNSRVSHFKNVEAIEMAQKSGVILLGFPPHCTHRLQPILSFIDRLSDHYDKAAARWLRLHTSRAISMFQISEIFGLAYVQAATIMEAINSFRICEIWIFDQDNFAPPDLINGVDTKLVTGDISKQIDVEDPSKQVDKEDTITQIDEEDTNTQLIVEITTKQINVEDTSVRIDVGDANKQMDVEVTISTHVDREETIKQINVEGTNTRLVDNTTKQIDVEYPSTRAVVEDTSKQMNTGDTSPQINVEDTNTQLAVEDTTKQIGLEDQSTRFDVEDTSKQRDTEDTITQIDAAYSNTQLIVEYTTKQIDVEDKSARINVGDANKQMDVEVTISTHVDREETIKQINVEDSNTRLVVEDATKQIGVEDQNTRFDVEDTSKQMDTEDTITQIDAAHANTQHIVEYTTKQNDVEDKSARIDVGDASKQTDLEVTISSHVDTEVTITQMNVENTNTRLVEDTTKQIDVEDTSKQMDTENTITQIDTAYTNSKLVVEDTTKQIDIEDPCTRVVVEDTRKQMDVENAGKQIDEEDPYIGAEVTINTDIDADDSCAQFDVVNSLSTNLDVEDTNSIEAEEGSYTRFDASDKISALTAEFRSIAPK